MRRLCHWPFCACQCRKDRAPPALPSSAVLAHHGVHVSDALECVVQAAVSHLTQHLLNRALLLLRVHKLRDAERLA